MIDWSQIQTAAEKEAEALALWNDAARAECRRRITQVVPETAQMNIAAAAAANMLTSAQMTTYRAGLGWIAAMRSTWPKLAADGSDLADDAMWPPVPAGVRELAGKF